MTPARAGVLICRWKSLEDEGGSGDGVESGFSSEDLGQFALGGASMGPSQKFMSPVAFFHVSPKQGNFTPPPPPTVCLGF